MLVHDRELMMLVCLMLDVSVFVVSLGGGAGGGAADTALKTKTPHVNVGKNGMNKTAVDEIHT